MVPGSWFGGLEASLTVAAPMVLGGRSHKLCLHHQAEMALYPNHWLLRLSHVRHLQRLHLQQHPAPALLTSSSYAERHGFLPQRI